jgi:colanic acid/amylovoran biosynthesis glycosyltransferase
MRRTAPVQSPPPVRGTALAALTPGARERRALRGAAACRLPFTDPTTREPLIVALAPPGDAGALSVLVEACALLAEGGAEFRCVIAGGTHEELVELLGEAAVFVALAGGAGAPPPGLLEAMALGTPCVATPLRAVPEGVVAGVTGLVVEERDPVGLSEALHEVLCSPRLRDLLARAARARLDALFGAGDAVAGARN